jgi:hypothetical protein
VGINQVMSNEAAHNQKTTSKSFNLEETIMLNWKIDNKGQYLITKILLIPNTTDVRLASSSTSV